MNLEQLIATTVREAVAAALTDLAPAAASEPDEVLNTRQAAKLLHLDEQTVRVEAEAGRLPGLLVGRGWKFSRAALLALLHRPNPTDIAQLRVQQTDRQAG